MKILVFDTETTGFSSPDLTLADQPYIVQFGAVQYAVDASANTWAELQRVDQLLSVPVTISHDCTRVHGIRNTDLIGKPTIAEYIDTMLMLFGGSDVAIAHNLSFDTTIIENELKRLGRGKHFLPKQTLCTMEIGTDLCAIPNGRGKYKYPKLTELYTHLFGTTFEGAHHALNDTLATARIAKELMQRKLFTPQEPVQMGLF